MAILNSTVVNGNLNVTGTVSAAGYSTVSDKRIKQNVQEFVPEASILDLPVYTYDYIGETTPKNQVGCIAQELQELFPQLVREESNGILTVQEAKLVYPLLIEVKRQREELEVLKKKLEQLESKFDRLD